MRVFQPTARGRWYVEFRGPDDKPHKMACFHTREATTAFAQNLRRALDILYARGFLDDAAQGWIAGLETRHKRRLSELGIARSLSGDLESCVDTFVTYLERRGNRPKSLAKTRQQLECMVIGLNWEATTPNDVLTRLAMLPSRLTPRTKNGYLKTVRHFARWMLAEGRSNNHRIAHMDLLPDKGNPLPARVLTREEVRTLLAVPPKRAWWCHNMPFDARYWLYRLALETGMRQGELRAMQVCWLFNDGIAIPSSVAKSGNAEFIPVSGRTMEDLLSWVDRDRYDKKVIGHLMPPETELASMLRADCKAAGIPTEGGNARRLNFHSLRHTYATLLEGSQELRKSMTRHASVTDLDRYTHVSDEERSRAAERVAAAVSGEESVETRNGHEVPAGASTVVLEQHAEQFTREALLAELEKAQARIVELEGHHR